MADALHNESWDIVIADYILPRFSGPAALWMSKNYNQDLPVIVISGKIGEEASADLAKAGAEDFIEKGKLDRLAPAVQRALEKKKDSPKKERSKLIPLKALIVEDSENDAFLLLDHLELEGYDVRHQRVYTADATKNALESGDWDLIISDYHIPGFGGMMALELFKKSGKDIPFILVSGKIGDEQAVLMIKEGAHDFVSKNRLSRLVPAIKRELNAATDRRLKKLTEESLHKLYDELDQRVRERTKELLESNLKLQEESAIRSVVEEERNLLSSAVEQAAETVIITDTTGSIQYVNPAFEQITGYTRQEVMGKTPRILNSGQHDRMFYKELWQTVTNGATWTGRFVNRKKDGTLYQEDATISPVVDASGKIGHYIALKKDVTREIETQTQLFRAQKMEALGTLAAGIAHDFNNLLTITSGFSDLMLRGKLETDRDYQNLQRIKVASQKGAELVQRLMAFSRTSEVKFKPININHIIKEVEKLLSRTIHKMIRIETSLPDALNVINGDSGQIEQVLMNLSVNAAAAMREDGRLIFRTENVHIDAESSERWVGCHHGNYVLLSVSDTGHGMDKETVEHIFEPFFTTKAPGEGTGLGLSIVYGIVKAHGGHVRCYSEPGKGTTFKIYFPVIAAAEQSAPRKVDAPLVGGKETVLLVDDEEAIIVLGSRALISVGYTVLTAMNGKEAIDVYNRATGKISLVVLDSLMPSMGGRECLQNLLRINPKLKIIIASGDSSPDHIDEFLQMGAKGFCAKPYTLADLLKAVRDALDGK